MIMEDEHVISILDINPINPGHALIVPKKHYPTLFEIPAPELQACILASQKVAQAVFRSVGASGLNLLQNNFRSAGQLIEHVHFHIIPRKDRDGFLTSWPGHGCPAGELKKVLDKVKAAL
jgi:histidine triad (HIT) family protein